MPSIHNKKSNVSTDRHLIAVLLTLIGLLGCLAIYNSRSFEANSLHFVYRQFIWIIAGLIIYYLSSSIPFVIYQKKIVLLGLLFWIPLVTVLFLGNKVNGMNGWFVLTINSHSIYIQPTELAKPIYILTMCILSSKINNEPTKIILLFLLYIIWTIPVLMEPDFGMTLIYSFVFITVYWINNGKKSYLFFILIILTISIFIVSINHPYVIKRIIAFINPLNDPGESGWHILQFKYAIARGGLTGAGLGNAFWSNSYLPLAHTDSIFASLVETLGIIGIIPILFGFIILFYFIYTLAIQQNNKLLIIISCTIISCITFQALIHISVNVGLFPPTGITLPLISYGGSSFASTMLSFGTLISLAMSKK